MLKPQPHYWLFSYLIWAHGRGPAAPGDVKDPSPDQKPFHISTTSTTRGQERTRSGPVPTRMMVLTFPFRVVHHNIRVIPYQVRHTTMGNVGLAPRAEPWPHRYLKPGIEVWRRRWTSLVQREVVFVFPVVVRSMFTEETRGCAQDVP